MFCPLEYKYEAGWKGTERPYLQQTEFSKRGKKWKNDFFQCSVISVVVVQSLSHFWLFETPWTAACQASLSFIISWSLFKLMSIELVVPSNHLIFYHSLLLMWYSCDEYHCLIINTNYSIDIKDLTSVILELNDLCLSDLKAGCLTLEYEFHIWRAHNNNNNIYVSQSSCLNYIK